MQNVTIEYNKELEGYVIEFLCEHCGKTVIKPTRCIRDPRILHAIKNYKTELEILHECSSGRLNKTIVFCEGIKYD